MVCKNITNCCIGRSKAVTFFGKDSKSRQLHHAAEQGVSSQSMTGRIGPDEGIEFILFEREEKHVIYFNWGSWPEEHFAAAELVGAETLKFSEPESENESYIFHRTGYDVEAEELMGILLSGFTIDDDFETKEHRIGEILGYTKEDVALYINNFRARA